MKLRPYQKESVAAIYRYFETESGNPLLVLPPAAGKSVVQAAFIKGIYKEWPDERIILLSHVKELLKQNAEKIRLLVPEVSMGYFSAGIGEKRIDASITVAGIQSVFKHADKFADVSLVIIDEAHLLTKSGHGMYRSFLAKLKELNPKVKVIGMTATPYRTDSGTLHQGEGRIFTDIAHEVSVDELIDQGFICNLVTKVGKTRANLSGVRIRGGDYVPGDLEHTMNTELLVRGACKEIVEKCADRNRWLIFCSGIEHAENVKKTLLSMGVLTSCVTGKTPKKNRDAMLGAFLRGEIRAMTNVGVLTTGFDNPAIDVVIMLRPTMSPGLYYQMVGRGLRLHKSKEDTLVLDFAGNIMEHGPINLIHINKATKEVEKAKMKECPECEQPCLMNAQFCEECGHEFVQERQPREPSHSTKATEAEIIGSREPVWKQVTYVMYEIHKKKGKPDSLMVIYKCGLRSFTEWVCFEHGGYAQEKAMKWWRQRFCDAMPKSTEEARKYACYLKTPTEIQLKKDGKYFQITGYKWKDK